MPDAANLIQNEDLAWTIYVTAKGTANVLMCLLVAWYSPGRFLRFMALGVALVYCAGAIDAGTGGYLFKENVWQYPVAAAFLALIWWAAKRFPGDDAKGE